MIVEVDGRELKVEVAKAADYDTHIVLVSGWNEVTPFVVWQLDPNGDVHNGQYCYDMKQALKCFNARS